MASQASGEPSDRRASGRKRNASTYVDKALTPFTAQIVSAQDIYCTTLTVGGQSLITETTETKECNFLSPNESLGPQIIRCVRVGTNVTIQFNILNGTTGGVSSNISSIGGEIPAEYRPITSQLVFPVLITVAGTKVTGWLEILQNGQYTYRDDGYTQFAPGTLVSVFGASVSYPGI